MKKAFTLIELVAAIAILTIVMGFAGVIFRVSVDSYRTAGANAEIMLKLRAITGQLNRDFQGLRKDGYLMLHSQIMPFKMEYATSATRADFRADKLYYFATGDFQSWLAPNLRSNITRVYFGHDSTSFVGQDADRPASEWNLVRDVSLISPGVTMPPAPADYNNVSYSQCMANIPGTRGEARDLLNFGYERTPVIKTNPNHVRRLMCENVGQIIIEWTTDGMTWWGMDNPIGGTFATEIEEKKTPLSYWAVWLPNTERQYWPRALRFTFTLYDSKRILKGGRQFTHIVYIDD